MYDFGEPGNDWLDLGGRRVNVPAKRIGNNQIVGAITLDHSRSKDLVEKTNREGFVESSAAEMFRRAVVFAVTQAELERNVDKDRIRRAYTKPKTKEPVLGEIEEMRDEIASLQLQNPQQDRLYNYLNQIDVQYRQVLDRWLTAAGAGLNLALVLHEVEKEIKWLYEDAVSGETEKILPKAKSLYELVDSLTWLTRQSGRKNVKASEIIKQCLFVWNFRYERHDVEIENGLDSGDVDFEILCNRRLVMTAVMNVIDNAIYWLGTKSGERAIYLGASVDGDKSSIVIADNGPGFLDPPEYLLEAFFTRKADGMGLGLHLCDEILKMQNGKLVFPEANEIELSSKYVGAVVALQFEGQK